MVARVAKECGGGSPLRLWLNEYGLDPKFFNALPPLDRLLLDNMMISELIKDQNEAQDKQTKKKDLAKKGIQPYESVDEWLSEVEAANEDSASSSCPPSSE